MLTVARSLKHRCQPLGSWTSVVSTATPHDLWANQHLAARGNGDLVNGTTEETLRIRVGSTFVRKRAEGEVHTVSKIIKHPEYDGFTDYDVALVKVVKPFQFSENVKPISMVSEAPATGSSGWGRTDNYDFPEQLLQVEVKIVDTDKCNQSYDGQIKDNMMCTGVPEGGKDACQKDSGGPLVYDGKLAGVVSWGIECGKPGIPGVYADVAYFNNWVSSVTKVN